MKRIFQALLLAILLPACENEAFTWGDYTHARLVGPATWTLGTDSILYTFSTRPADVMEQTFAAEIIIMGEAAPRDRSVHLVVDDEFTTATGGTHYSVPASVTIPAGQTRAACPVTVRRTSELQSASVRLRVRVADTGDIPPGVVEWSALSIRWNDMISRPLNWDDLTEFFGGYSDVKFRFIISTLGIAEFTYLDAGGMTWGVMYNYRLLLAEALAAYNAAHPTAPLTDENNQLVTF